MSIGYAKFYSRSHDAAIRVYDERGNVIETFEHGRVQGAVVLGSFTDCSGPLAAQPCSFQAVHSLSAGLRPTFTIRHLNRFDTA
jgi:hypothetical protein